MLLQQYSGNCGPLVTVNAEWRGDSTALSIEGHSDVTEPLALVVIGYALAIVVNVYYSLVLSAISTALVGLSLDCNEYCPHCSSNKKTPPLLTGTTSLVISMSGLNFYNINRITLKGIKIIAE